MKRSLMKLLSLFLLVGLPCILGSSVVSASEEPTTLGLATTDEIISDLKEQQEQQKKKMLKEEELQKKDEELKKKEEDLKKLEDEKKKKQLEEELKKKEEELKKKLEEEKKVEEKNKQQEEEKRKTTLVPEVEKETDEETPTPLETTYEIQAPLLKSLGTQFKNISELPTAIKILKYAELTILKEKSLQEIKLDLLGTINTIIEKSLTLAQSKNLPTDMDEKLKNVKESDPLYLLGLVSTYVDWKEASYGEQYSAAFIALPALLKKIETLFKDEQQGLEKLSKIVEENRQVSNVYDTLTKTIDPAIETFYTRKHDLILGWLQYHWVDLLTASAVLVGITAYCAYNKPFTPWFAPKSLLNGPAKQITTAPFNQTALLIKTVGNNLKNVAHNRA